MIKKFLTILERPLLTVSSICSVVSVVVLCFSDIVGFAIVTAVLCLSIFIFLAALLRVLNRFLESDTGRNHNCVSSFVTYRTDDGDSIVFESYKLIQVKCCIMQVFDIGFKWSGKHNPQISSDLQTVETYHFKNDVKEYDEAKLKLRVPALYNQTTLIHFRTKTNDVEHLSEPKVELAVKYPIEYIQVNVILGYKSSFCSPAKVERIRMDGNLPQSYETLDSTPFDTVTKQYSYRLINPEPGYFYKISWVR